MENFMISEVPLAGWKQLEQINIIERIINQATQPAKGLDPSLLSFIGSSDKIWLQFRVTLQTIIHM